MMNVVLKLCSLMDEK